MGNSWLCRLTACICATAILLYAVETAAASCATIEKSHLSEWISALAESGPEVVVATAEESLPNGPMKPVAILALLTMAHVAANGILTSLRDSETDTLRVCTGVQPAAVGLSSSQLPGLAKTFALVTPTSAATIGQGIAKVGGLSNLLGALGQSSVVASAPRISPATGDNPPSNTSGQPWTIPALPPVSSEPGQARIRGSVFDVTSRGELPEATVKLTGPWPSSFFVAKYVSGSFEFADLPPGTYFLSVAVPGYTPNGRWVTVKAFASSRADIGLAPGRQCRIDVSNRTPWSVTVYVTGYHYSPMPLAGGQDVSFPANPYGPTQLLARADFRDYPPIIWPYTLSCQGYQTVPLYPPRE